MQELGTGQAGKDILLSNPKVIIWDHDEHSSIPQDCKASDTVEFCAQMSHLWPKRTRVAVGDCRPHCCYFCQATALRHTGGRPCESMYVHHTDLQHAGPSRAFRSHACDCRRCCQQQALPGLHADTVCIYNSATLLLCRAQADTEGASPAEPCSLAQMYAC